MKGTKKGGYQIVSLLMLDILTLGATKIDGIYATIEGTNNKPIMLCDIVIDGVEQKPVMVTPKVVDGNYILENVYEYDITIGDDDTVEFTEHPTGAVTRQAIVNASGLVTPLETPTEEELVGIGTNGAQSRIEIGDGLRIEEGKLKANGGLPEEFIKFIDSDDASLRVTRNTTIIDAYNKLTTMGAKVNTIIFLKTPQYPGASSKESNTYIGTIRQDVSEYDVSLIIDGEVFSKQNANGTDELSTCLVTVE